MVAYLLLFLFNTKKMESTPDALVLSAESGLDKIREVFARRLRSNLMESTPSRSRSAPRERPDTVPYVKRCDSVDRSTRADSTDRSTITSTCAPRTLSARSNPLRVRVESTSSAPRSIPLKVSESRATSSIGASQRSTVSQERKKNAQCALRNSLSSRTISRRSSTPEQRRPGADQRRPVTTGRTMPWESRPNWDSKGDNDKNERATGSGNSAALAALRKAVPIPRRQVQKPEQKQALESRTSASASSAPCSPVARQQVLSPKQCVIIAAAALSMATKDDHSVQNPRHSVRSFASSTEAPSACASSTKTPSACASSTKTPSVCASSPAKTPSAGASSPAKTANYIVSPAKTATTVCSPGVMSTLPLSDSQDCAAVSCDSGIARTYDGRNTDSIQPSSPLAWSENRRRNTVISVPLSPSCSFYGMCSPPDTSRKDVDPTTLEESVLRRVRQEISQLTSRVAHLEEGDSVHALEKAFDIVNSVSRTTNDAGGSHEDDVHCLVDVLRAALENTEQKLTHAELKCIKLEAENGLTSPSLHVGRLEEFRDKEKEIEKLRQEKESMRKDLEFKLHCSEEARRDQDEVHLEEIVRLESIIRQQENSIESLRDPDDLAALRHRENEAMLREELEEKERQSLRAVAVEYAAIVEGEKELGRARLEESEMREEGLKEELAALQRSFDELQKDRDQLLVRLKTTQGEIEK